VKKKAQDICPALLSIVTASFTSKKRQKSRTKEKHYFNGTSDRIHTEHHCFPLVYQMQCFSTDEQLNDVAGMISTDEQLNDVAGRM